MVKNNTVLTPIIFPDQTIFTISATLSVICETPDSTIFYTIDGTDPIPQLSFLLPEDSLVVFDSPGSNTIKAIAIKPPLNPSEIASKTFVIYRRAAQPIIQPIEGDYIGDLEIQFLCPSDSIVYFTTDHKSTPIVSSTTPHVKCNHYFSLQAPGSYFVRAIVSTQNMTTSAITTSIFRLQRPPFDEIRISTPLSPLSPQYLPIRWTQSLSQNQHSLISGSLVVIDEVHRLEFGYVSDECGPDASLSLPTPLSQCEVAVSLHPPVSCSGQLVKRGKAVLLDPEPRLSFGVRGESVLVGEVGSGEASNASHPFFSLVPGMMWLVRSGRSNLDSSPPLLSLPSNLLNHSSRQLLGVSKGGRVMMLNVDGGREGEEGGGGLDLISLTSLAIELGFESALLVGGGGAGGAVWVNGTLVSRPSLPCPYPYSPPYSDTCGDLCVCPESPSLLACLLPPPTLIPTPPPSFLPSLAPSIPPSHIPTLFPSPSPSILSTNFPSSLPSSSISCPPYSLSLPSNISSLESLLYTPLSPSNPQALLLVSLVLSALLALSLFLNLCFCLCQGRKKLRGEGEEEYERETEMRNLPRFVPPSTQSPSPSLSPDQQVFHLSLAPSRSQPPSHPSPSHPSPSPSPHWRDTLSSLSFSLDDSDDEEDQDQASIASETSRRKSDGTGRNRPKERGRGKVIAAPSPFGNNQSRLRIFPDSKSKKKGSYRPVQNSDDDFEGEEEQEEERGLNPFRR